MRDRRKLQTLQRARKRQKIENSGGSQNSDSARNGSGRSRSDSERRSNISQVSDDVSQGNSGDQGRSDGTDNERGGTNEGTPRESDATSGQDESLQQISQQESQRELQQEPQGESNDGDELADVQHLINQAKLLPPKDAGPLMRGLFALLKALANMGNADLDEIARDSARRRYTQAKRQVDTLLPKLLPGYQRGEHASRESMLNRILSNPERLEQADLAEGLDELNRLIENIGHNPTRGQGFIRDAFNLRDVLSKLQEVNADPVGERQLRAAVSRFKKSSPETP